MKASIETKDFIKFLKLFGEKGSIEDLQIGDTLYKREGWIDKSILKGNHSIEGILNLDYEFNGLQGFNGIINEYNIKLAPRTCHNLEFIIEANKNKLRDLEFKIIEQNAFTPEIFRIRYLKSYEH